jgi:hypothetical protein
MSATHATSDSERDPRQPIAGPAEGVKRPRDLQEGNSVTYERLSALARLLGRQAAIEALRSGVLTADMPGGAP